MDSQPRNLYPKVLTPYQILQVNPYNCNLQILKYAFKMKMQGNESPEIRLSYDMYLSCLYIGRIWAWDYERSQHIRRLLLKKLNNDHWKYYELKRWF